MPHDPMPEDHASLAEPALRLFFKIATLWSMTEAEQFGALGISSQTTLQHWRTGRMYGFGEDQLQRVSYVLGIYKAINTLLPDPIRADQWIRRPNSAPLFRGRSAIDLIASGSLTDLAAVRHYLDAQLER
ncbi:antitoxin Xre/MbcA/ParS toxin-binding domain-containing protein [Altericroceibacterium endophyticum]|uniref:DUF2384 domain-containing protein n=1 Tax=Altericroceibacterium endophyticum TaxID=1808508 RepID=A0A6I4T7K5_9SPHN|nr:antitoxin Xre/MbcA/ParS toxin-binding domain-containing protein [Altericroceibacterium endophyticum]MXO65963.1 DUF2384 domain-containing protein [Altericroceibacterium endophyticum]